MGDPTIRSVTMSDSQAIADLSAQLGYSSSPGQVERRLKAVSGQSDHAVLIACLAEGSVVGWVHVFQALRVESNAFAELGGLVVGEGYRGRGIGRLLVKAAEEWAGERDIPNLRVRTHSARAEAQGFYLGLGFELAKEQHVFDKTLEPDL